MGFVVCIDNTGHEDKLTIGETYQVRSRPGGYRYRLRHSRSIFPPNLFASITDFKKPFKEGDEVCLAFSAKDIGGFGKLDYKTGTVGIVTEVVGPKVNLTIYGVGFTLYSALLYEKNKGRLSSLDAILGKLAREVANGK